VFSQSTFYYIWGGLTDSTYLFFTFILRGAVTLVFIVFRLRTSFGEYKPSFLRSFNSRGIEINVQKSGIPLPDESDRIFYDVAKISNAYLITGNIKHYPIETWIMAPAAFITLIDV